MDMPGGLFIKTRDKLLQRRYATIASRDKALSLMAWLAGDRYFYGQRPPTVGVEIAASSAIMVCNLVEESLTKDDNPCGNVRQRLLAYRATITTSPEQTTTSTERTVFLAKDEPSSVSLST